MGDRGGSEYDLARRSPFFPSPFPPPPVSFPPSALLSDILRKTGKKAHIPSMHTCKWLEGHERKEGWLLPCSAGLYACSGLLASLTR